MKSKDRFGWKKSGILIVDGKEYKGKQIPAILKKIREMKDKHYGN